MTNGQLTSQGPKTSTAGYAGMLLLAVAGLAQGLPGKWGTTITMAALVGSKLADSLGNVFSADRR